MEIVEVLHGTLGGAEGFWLAVTNLGHDYAFILLLTLYLWLVSPRGGRVLGVFFALAIIVDALLNLTVNAQRPFEVNPALASDEARETSGGSSFPSGHALVSAALWGLAALQVGRRWFTWLAVGVVVLIGLSRLVLGLHYPTDVLAGLAIGALVAVVGARVRLPSREYILPAVALLLAAFLLKSDLTAGLGILAGFWLARPTFEAPREWLGRAAFVIGGLVMVFAVYLAFSVIPSEWRANGAVSALRYVALVLTATQLVPRLLLRFTTRPVVTAAS